MGYTEITNPASSSRSSDRTLNPDGLTSGFGGGIGLTDCVIHYQDIRRPLALPRAVPRDRLLVALDISLRAPVLPSRHNAAGVRAVATVVDWQPATARR